MKKAIITSVGLLSIGASFNANAMWWGRDEVKCTATNKIHFEFLDQSLEFSETWEGIKKVCRDGADWFCWSTSCS